MVRGGISRSRPVYTEEEELIIKRHFNPLKAEESCKEIHRNYLRHRSPSAIAGKASKMGLQRPLRIRPWEPEEIDILNKWTESTPLCLLYERLKALWDSKGWSSRGYPTVRRKLVEMEYCLDDAGDGVYFNQRQLAAALGCSNQVIVSWCKDKTYSAVLKPEKPSGDHGTVFIHVRNVRRFMRQYPGEIAKLRPDILWLLSVVFDAGDRG